jgi:hypothetical protein
MVDLEESAGETTLRLSHSSVPADVIEDHQ